MDLNKVLLYGFHDNYIKSQYGNNSRLLFTYIYIYIYIYIIEMSLQQLFMINIKMFC